MIICDTGPLVSAMNRGERRRHLFAAKLLASLGREVVVPWPVLVETDLLLRSRGRASAAVAFAQALLVGEHRLATPTTPDLQLAARLGKRYIDSGADLPDLIVMSMAHHRKAQILTWDFRHFRSVILRRGHHWPLLVDEAELPPP